MYKALYREYRPEVFDSVLGQEHIVKILKNQIANDSVAHAYLFCGTRGTGKTTMARLLAKGVNCLENEKPCGECENCKAIKNGTFLDVIEIDAASNNGVDNIRDIRESVNYPPALGKKKVYIIDEVHMLSTGAFNALLKTLEEPPEDVIFILATTEPQKLPATIMSRCLTLDFRRVTEKQLVLGMRKIIDDIGIKVEADALALIARNADGSVRDGLSILDQCIAAGDEKISYDDVLEILGTVGDNALIDMTDLIISQKNEEVLLFLSKLIDDGREVKELTKEFLRHYRNLLICKFVKNSNSILDLSAENEKRLKLQAEKLTLSELHRAIFLFSRTLGEIKWSTQPRVLLELTVVQLVVGDILPEDEIAVDEENAREKKESVSKLALNEAKEKIAELKKSKKPQEIQPSSLNADTQYKVKNAEGGADYKEIWKKLCNAYIEKNATFNFLINSAELWEITDKNFVISALNPVTQKTLEANRADVEEGMKKFAGVSLPMLVKLKAVLETAEDKKNEIDVEKTKQELESKLNLGIEIV